MQHYVARLATCDQFPLHFQISYYYCFNTLDELPAIQTFHIKASNFCPLFLDQQTFCKITVFNFTLFLSSTTEILSGLTLPIHLTILSIHLVHLVFISFWGFFMWRLRNMNIQSIESRFSWKIHACHKFWWKKLKRVPK